MSISEPVQIRDYIFRETVSCPLKLSFLLQEGFNDQRDDLFRRKSKRMLREAAAQLFEDVLYTSDQTDAALKETKKWLKNERVTICGAVVKEGKKRARIPILLKENRKFTVVQVHGKLVKGDPENLFHGIPRGKSLNRYLLMAAYRKYILQSAFPDADIHCLFMFPLKSYRADVNHLFQKTMGKRNIEKDALKELSDLFVSVNGTSSVRKTFEQIPSDISHGLFSGLSIRESVEKIHKIDPNGRNLYVDSAHSACKYCTFRRSDRDGKGKKGCWDIHFPDHNINNNDRHQFELIGHHVNSNYLHEEMYQEQILQPSGLNTFENVINHTDKKIAIYHRKAMQLLEAKDRPLPLVFAKPFLNDLKNLEYPIHFLDFEAASHAVPFQSGKKSYDPVLFQFSCHTLFKKGGLKHTQWLDQNPGSNIHHQITEALSGIPDYDRGTIIQYSPFEKQALNKLYNEMSEDKASNRSEIDILEKILYKRTPHAGSRFLDLSALLRDGYYNRFLNNGLGLKQIFLSVLETESILGTIKSTEFFVNDLKINVLKKDGQGNVMDPYNQISDERTLIQDGITAMHAYLCLKAGALSADQLERVPVLLKRYCSMDTLALYIIFSHLTNLTRLFPSDENIVIDI